jgi:multiple sugar transport system ATP-binding protein
MGELELETLTKVFQDGNDQVIAVDDVNVTIEDGEFLVVVGPSGCGKSTTLRMVAGLESITAGTIRLNDEVINDVKPQHRDIAMVFQSYALYPHMSVRGNMAFGLEESTNMPDDEIDERVEDAAGTMGIEDLLDRQPADLSGGQRQRVALGRAIVRDPEVFLMDEPLSNLDAKLRSQMRTELLRLQSDLDVTTMYVTHDQTEAMTMGDRIAILDAGALQQVGPPLECYYEPNNRFVAGFIGEPSMNFVEMEANDGTLQADIFEYDVAEDIQDAIAGTTDVTMGIRPESLTLVDEPGGDHVYETVVDVVEPRGDENTVYLSFDEPGDRATTLIATTEGYRDEEPGDAASVKLPEDSIHLFDRETGDALHTRRSPEASEG